MRVRVSLFLLTLPGLLGCGDLAPSTSLRKGAARDASIAAGSGSLELDGQPFDLWQGRQRAVGTVIVFTRSDCPISNRYAPTIRFLCDAYQQRGVDFFLVYVDPQESADGIRRHQQQYQYTCPGLRDPRHVLVAECGATVTPEAVVFDAHRSIVYRGRIDDLYADFGQARTEATTHELADAIDAVVAGQPVAQQATKAVGCYIGDLR